MLVNLDDVIRDLRDLADELEQKAAPEALKPGLAVLHAGVSRRVPRRTGALAATEYDTAPSDQRHYVEGAVVVTSDHAAANEFGTSKMAAQPFMRPTADSDGDRAADAAADALGVALDGMV